MCSEAVPANVPRLKTKLTFIFNHMTTMSYCLNVLSLHSGGCSQASVGTKHQSCSCSLTTWMEPSWFESLRQTEVRGLLFISSIWTAASVCAMSYYILTSFSLLQKQCLHFLGSIDLWVRQLKWFDLHKNIWYYGLEKMRNVYQCLQIENSRAV